MERGTPYHDQPHPPAPATTHAPAAILSDERRGRGRLVLEAGRELARAAVVAREAVDAGLDEDEAELGVLVLAVALQVLFGGGLPCGWRVGQCCRSAARRNGRSPHILRRQTADASLG